MQEVQQAFDELAKELEGRDKIPPHVQTRIDDLATRARMIKDQLQIKDQLPQPDTLPNQPGAQFYQGPTGPVALIDD